VLLLQWQQQPWFPREGACPLQKRFAVRATKLKILNALQGTRAFFLLLLRLLPALAFKAALAGFFCNGNNKPLGAFLAANAFKGHVLLLFLLRKNKRSTCPLKALAAKGYAQQ